MITLIVNKTDSDTGNQIGNFSGLHKENGVPSGNSHKMTLR